MHVNGVIWNKMEEYGWYLSNRYCKIGDVGSIQPVLAGS